MHKLIGFALLPLAACTTVAAEEPATVGGGGECRGEGLDRFVGQPATSELAAEMMRVSGATKFQWVPKGSMVTMDYRTERLRVFLDDKNRVERASCG